MKKGTGHRLLYATAALILLLTLVGCGGGGAGGGGAGGLVVSSVSLTWDATTTNTDGSPIADLAGYKVYYGTSSGSYSTSVDVGNVTSVYIVDLTSGTTYYFAVTSYNSFGHESAYSNEFMVVV
jgi:hypothetical protein